MVEGYDRSGRHFLAYAVVFVVQIVLGDAAEARDCVPADLWPATGCTRVLLRVRSIRDVFDSSLQLTWQCMGRSVCRNRLYTGRSMRAMSARTPGRGLQCGLL